jgi:hypothetical protein
MRRQLQRRGIGSQVGGALNRMTITIWGKIRRAERLSGAAFIRQIVIGSRGNYSFALRERLLQRIHSRRQILPAVRISLYPEEPGNST